MCCLQNKAVPDYQESVWLLDRQTDAGQSDPNVPLCFAVNTKMLLFLVIFQRFPSRNCHFRPKSWKACPGWCDVELLYNLQSYFSFRLCKRIIRGEPQIRIEVATLPILANPTAIYYLSNPHFLRWLKSSLCQLHWSVGHDWCKLTRTCERFPLYDDKITEKDQCVIKIIGIHCESPLASMLVATSHVPMTS